MRNDIHSPRLRPHVVKARLERARMGLGRRLAYRVRPRGYGGYNAHFPNDPGWDATACDCSGFLSWVLMTQRAPKPGRRFWIESTAIWSDATGEQTTFARLPGPEPGCIAVYPDRRVLGIRREGHVALITEAETAPGKPWVIRKLRGIDCSAGSFRKTGDSVQERDLTFLLGNSRTVFCALKQDVER